MNGWQRQDFALKELRDSAPEAMKWRHAGLKPKSDFRFVFGRRVQTCCFGISSYHVSNIGPAARSPVLLPKRRTGQQSAKATTRQRTTTGIAPRVDSCAIRVTLRRFTLARSSRAGKVPLESHIVLNRISSSNSFASFSQRMQSAISCSKSGSAWNALSFLRRWKHSGEGW